MAELGLLASSWAPNSENSRSFSGSLEWDWNCFSCGYSNFSWRTKCYKCSKMKGEPPGREYEPRIVTQRLMEVDTRRDNSTQPLSSKTNESTQDIFVHHSRGRGLLTSRWAPRNCSGNQWRPRQAEIWTRTIEVHPVNSRPFTNEAPIINSSPPDLGLPYEVQHYILCLIQRILEDGCWDFGTRWIPQILKEYKWTCSEAVELSNWRKTLPDAVPAAALAPTSTTPSLLNESLTHAVRIRNSAVHRHLCDNEELRQMAVQAQKLMRKFNDSVREDKLHRLWYALKDWDMAKSDDADAKRKKLEVALQEVAEMKVDDMDWTPNTVSLEEIGDMNDYSDTQSGSDARWAGDQMDLD